MWLYGGGHKDVFRFFGLKFRGVELRPLLLMF